MNYQKRVELKSTNIKGKDYVEVNTRVQFFRENKDYEGWSLITEIVELSEKRVILKAVIKNKEGTVIATGLAYEDASASYINKTSYIENCETSAWGRALGNLGIGITTSIASKEEVESAIYQQEIKVKPTGPTIYDHTNDSHKKILWGFAKKLGFEPEQAFKISESATAEKITLDHLNDFIQAQKQKEISEG